LRRDERNLARSRDTFVQTEWAPWPGMQLSAGLRAGRVRLQAEDRFLDNGDDSGRRELRYRNPVLGLHLAAAPGLMLHASLARGFESPTLGELAYRSDGTGGFNTALRPQTSRQAELGAKWRPAAALELDATLFAVAVRDEIGVASNAGGRSSFQNVGRTRRSGAELAWLWRPAPSLRMQSVLSTLDARYRDTFLACAGLPCTAPSVTVPAGRRVAGTHRASAWAELAWNAGAARELGLEWRGVSRTAADDANSAFAAGHGVLALRWRERLAGPAGWRAELLARIDNLADRRYAGTVIVNEASGRYFEPAPPRALLVALRLTAAR
jgi:iron complex outermembrane receptor protein